MTNSARHGLPYLSAGQAQKEVTHNEALTLIDAGLHACALAAGVDVPPSAPTAGECWIVGNAPVGAWAGAPDALACWTESGWRLLAAREGMTVWLADQQLWAVRRGAEWRIGELVGSSVTVGGLQVVGTRQPAVAAPAGGATVDAEARAAIEAILARLSSHGLIAD